MKGLSPVKLRIIIALNFAAIALLVGLFFINPKNEPADANPLPPAPHQRLRTAQISLNPALSWELTLSGGETEEAVAAFVRDGYLYIFGNTSSSDLDFDRSGIFLSIIDVYGLTKGFFIYGGEGEILRSVCPCEGGFLLAAEAPSAPKLFVVDFYGGETRVISGFINSFEGVSEIKYYPDGYLLFSGGTNSLTGVKSLRCSFFSPSLQFSGSRLATSPYSLELFESVVVSGRAVVLCNATSSLHTLPAAVEFSLTESTKIHIFTGYSGRIMGLSLYDGDFLLLTAMEGSSLLQIGLDYTVKSRVFLSQLSAQSLAEVGRDAPSQLYLVFMDTSVILINGKGERKAALPAFVPASRSDGRAFAKDLVVYAGTGGVRAYGSAGVVYSANIGGGEDSFIAIDENNLFYIYHSAGDVCVAKLRTVY